MNNTRRRGIPKGGEIRRIALSIVAVSALAFGGAACGDEDDDVDVTVPDIDVTVPDIDVTVPDIDVTVPDIDVTVPDIDVTTG